MARSSLQENPMIRNATGKDASAIAEIYNYYILNSTATFEITPVSTDSMKQRVALIQQNSLPWLIAESETGKLIGYAYASKWKEREAYINTVEVTVYIDQAAQSQGLGSKLYSALFADLEKRSIHAVIGGISLPNEASVALHEKFGMKKVAHFSEVGIKFENWIDVGYWQVLLNT